jgi:hypothetical protein
MGRQAALIFAGGAATMLAELALLRYVPGNVRVLGYFTNFALLAAFVGLGTGMLGARRWGERPWLARLAPIAFAAVVFLTELGRRVEVKSSGEDSLFLEYQTPMFGMSLEPFLALSYVLLAVAFVPLGYFVGTTLEGDRSLVRYAWNVAGSLAGVAAFSALSAASARPAVWMALAIASLSVPLLRAPVVWRVVGLACAIATIALVARVTTGAVWSPYQKISIAPLRVHPTLGIVGEWTVRTLEPEERAQFVTLPESEGFTIRVNDDSYQWPVDLGDDALARHPSLAWMRLQYELPFTLRAPGSVLVVGAGSGNDVAAALRAGATHVDAVEIDPEILALGKRHPEHPYDDPRVTTHASDARSFLVNGAGSYDTIVYGLLDSHVLLSSMSNVRLDSFVFTVESLALARSRLRPGGILVVSHAVGTPWFVQRMRATLTRAFEKPPIILSEQVTHPLGIVYVAGDALPPGRPPAPDAGILEDDWPFLYLRARRIPREYLVAMALMAVASLAFVRLGAGARFRAFDAHFFFLGAGFLLLETRGLAVMSLLLGTTWGVTSSVFAAVLVMALAASLLAARIDANARAVRVVSLVYVLLAATLLLLHVVDPGDLAAVPYAARLSLGAALTALPLLASGFVFATSLARAGEADRALASNLTGAIAGGLVEYVSMMTGFRALVLVAAGFYGAAWFAARRR